MSCLSLHHRQLTAKVPLLAEFAAETELAVGSAAAQAESTEVAVCTPGTAAEVCTVQAVQTPVVERMCSRTVTDPEWPSATMCLPELGYTCTARLAARLLRPGTG